MTFGATVSSEAVTSPLEARVRVEFLSTVNCLLDRLYLAISKAVCPHSLVIPGPKTLEGGLLITPWADASTAKRGTKSEDRFMLYAQTAAQRQTWVIANDRRAKLKKVLSGVGRSGGSNQSMRKRVQKRAQKP